MSTTHTFQFRTISQLRRIHKDNTTRAEQVAAQARALLATAEGHAALARDAALLLEVADSEWTPERDESPEIKRMMQVKGWREALDFLEAHPEIAISDYHSLTLQAPDGSSTPEFVASLEEIGIGVDRSETRVRAERWFGDHAVSLCAWAKFEPKPEPVDGHQALEAVGGQTDAAAEQLPGADVVGRIQRGIAEAESGQTVYRGSFAEHADADENQPDEEKFHLGDTVTVIKPGQLAELEKSPGRVVDVVVEDSVRFGVEFPGDGEPYILYLAAEQLQLLVDVEGCLADQPA